MTNIDLAAAQPSFLRRTPAKENTAMTPAPTPTKAPKTKRRDALRAHITVDLVLDLSDPKAMENATTAINDMLKGLPADAVVEKKTGLVKV